MNPAQLLNPKAFKKTAAKGKSTNGVLLSLTRLLTHYAVLRSIHLNLAIAFTLPTSTHAAVTHFATLTLT